MHGQMASLCCSSLFIKWKDSFSSLRGDLEVQICKFWRHAGLMVDVVIAVIPETSKIQESTTMAQNNLVGHMTMITLRTTVY